MTWTDIDWEEMLAMSTSPVELIVRGSMMYWALFLFFRFILRRDAGSVGVTDFLFVVLLGDASQNAMIGTADSVADGMVLVGTLIFWNVSLDYLSFRFPAIERVAMGKRLILYKHGQLNRRNMRREFITMEELMSKVREHGHEDLSEVNAVYLEASGEMTVTKIG